MLLNERLRLLVVGNGGREHALAWKLSQSRLVDCIFTVPGNGGTDSSEKLVNIPDIKVDDYPAMVSLAKKHGINLVVPGPEAPLVDGIQGYFRAIGIRCFGPSKAAARMEGSKTFSKDFMSRHNIPTARYQNFSKYEAAARYLDSVSYDVVIKASGLAAGKGVIIPTSKVEAHQALREIMLDRQFGEAGDEVVIEEFLDGEELSVLTFSDGYTIMSLPPAQDHKRIFDDDKGPNTGGMGCYAPATVASKEMIAEIDRDIVQPTIDGMRKEGFPFVGMLFTGLMMTKSGPRVLEYNVRGGDPETQTLLPLLSPETDLAEIMVASTEHWLDGVEVKIQPKFATTVVAAAKGYPGLYKKGTEITLDKTPADTMIFHAGTALVGETLKSSGGRVIAVTATAAALEDAVSRAYEGMKTIHFDGMHYRKDIAHRAFNQSLSTTNNAAPAIPKNSALTYASSGVSVDSGNRLVSLIKPLVASTSRPGTDAVIGGFGGHFSLRAAGYTSPPSLVSAIDGVGTKLKVAHETSTHDTVGIDLVAMNVNDLVVQGAEPLFFLDCYSCNTLDVDVASSFVSGVAAGCKEAGCALIGGETAEMPGLFASPSSSCQRTSSDTGRGIAMAKKKQSDNHYYDAVGAAVGAMPEGQRILPDTASMREGDVLLGLASSGVHSNGFSLVRKILETNGLSYQEQVPWLDDGGDNERERLNVNNDTPAPATNTPTTIGQSLLTPTKIYVKPLLSVLRKYNNITNTQHNTDDSRGLAPAAAAVVTTTTTTTIKGLAHITGGGLLENVPRMLPPYLRAEINVNSWKLPDVFRWMKRGGGGGGGNGNVNMNMNMNNMRIAPMEMARTFNCGVGMVAVVGVERAQEVKRDLEGLGETVYTIGVLGRRRRKNDDDEDEGQCVLLNLESWDYRE